MEVVGTVLMEQAVAEVAEVRHLTALHQAQAVAAATAE